MQPTKNIIECKCCKNVYHWKPEDEAVIPRAEWSKKHNRYVPALVVFCPLCKTPHKIKVLEV